MGSVLGRGCLLLGMRAASMLDAASFSILVFMLAQLLCVVVSGIAVIRLSTNIHALGVHFRFVLSGIVCWSCFGKIAQLLLVLVVLFLLANIIISMYSLFSFVWYSQLLLVQIELIRIEQQKVSLLERGQEGKKK